MILNQFGKLRTSAAAPLSTGGGIERNGHEDDGASGLGEEFDGGQLGGTGEASGDDSQATNRSRPDSAITTPSETERDTGHGERNDVETGPEGMSVEGNQPSPGPYEGGAGCVGLSIGDDLGMETFSRWSIAAVHLPNITDNLHTVEGDLAAGYDGAVVAAPRCSPISPVRSAAWGRTGRGWWRSWSVGPCWPTSESWWPAGPTRSWRRSVVACAPAGARRRAETPSRRASGWSRLSSNSTIARSLRRCAGEDLEPTPGSSWSTRCGRHRIGCSLPSSSMAHGCARAALGISNAAPGGAVVIESWEVDRFSTRGGERPSSTFA